MTALAACATLLTGCGSGPSQAGAAAIVGSEAVPLSDTQRAIDEALGQPKLVENATPSVISSLAAQEKDSAKYQNLPLEQQREITRSLFGRIILSRQIQHLLITEAARRENLSVNPAQVNAALARQAREVGAIALAFDPASVREAMEDRLLTQALAAKYVDRLQITADVMTVNGRANAMKAAHLLAKGGAIAVNTVRAAGPNGSAGVRMRAAVVAPTGSIFLFGTPANEVVAAYTGGDSYTVWRVTDRRTTPPPPGSVSIATVLGSDALYAVGTQLLQPLSEELGVRVNPRYGVWDAPNVMVLGADQQTSLVLPVDQD
ncbi:MAG TPA: hypothetical protein VFE65_01300 [Pseudonocardia sp.]|nr:hypothetical protein [Pseudonocardia sp.]